MLLLSMVTVALGQDVLILEGEVPDDGLDHFRLPFEVPEGIAEIEVRHDDLSEANILDWGLDDPAGWRGWGGGNTEPVVLNERAASRSYLPGPIAAGTWSVVVGKAQIAETPARYRVEIELRTEVTLPEQTERAPYVPVPALETGPRWYAGDLHVHSTESGDAHATLDEIADFARQRGLDFVVVTDHNTISHLDWLVSAQARHPDLLLIPGTEFTTYQGHAGAFGVRSWVDHKLGQPGVTLEAAAEAYAAQGALLSLNHPVLDLGDRCIGCAWELPIPAGLAGIEIGTGGWEPVGRLFTPDVLLLWEELCDQGHRPAAIGGSDDHRAGTDTGPFASPIGSPTTLVFAEELSERAILEGIAAGRTVVKLQEPADPMVELSLEDRTVRARVTGGLGHTLVWVVDGVYGERQTIDSDPQEVTLTLPEGAARARAEVHVDGFPRTVASHVWVQDDRAPAAPPEARGCGCGTPAASVRLESFVAIFLLAGLTRLRRAHAERIGEEGNSRSRARRGITRSARLHRAVR